MPVRHIDGTPNRADRHLSAAAHTEVGPFDTVVGSRTGRTVEVRTRVARGTEEVAVTTKSTATSVDRPVVIRLWASDGRRRSSSEVRS